MRKLRTLLAGVAGAAALLAGTSLATVAPAHADAATSCSAISVSGSVEPTQIPASGDTPAHYGLVWHASGGSPKPCFGIQAGGTYRYVLTLQSGRTGTIESDSGSMIMSTSTGHTGIFFGDKTFTAPTGAGTMVLTIHAEFKASTTWNSVGRDQVYSIGVPNDSYDTSGMTQSYGTGSCHGSGPIVGYGGWC